ncbi:MAG: hypothetical protein D3926_16820 [Desulfobacteraceae bacterium]|nr:MAG: hypothetical protein D3926_16820 [Desulfobacteraceae bacterium]
MSYAGYASHTAPFLTTVNDDQIHEIIQAAFLILEQTGCTVDHDGALGLLASAGARIDGNRVCVPRHVIESALQQAPKGFVMFNRNGDPAMDLTGRKSYFGSSTASPNQRHAYDHTRKPTTIEDIGWGAKVADALENIDFAMPFGSAQDVPAQSGDLFEFETAVQNTIKPIFFCGYSSKGVEFIIEMAAEIAGGRGALAQKPFIAAYPEPISPLQFPRDIVEKIRVCAQNWVPQVVSGAQFLGFTAPCTVAGSLALATAESFFGILLVQLFNGGAPCCLTCSPGGGNMRTGISFIASPEMTLALTAQAQIARTLGLPTWGLAGATDSKKLDAQAGAEAALSAALQALAGVNIIHDVGYMDMGMMCSCAMMVTGNEIIHWVKRFISGIDVNADTLAAEVVNAVGPGGNFLTQKHTLNYMRKEVWQPELFFKDSYDAWVNAGSTSLEERADQRVDHILKTHEPRPLDQDIIHTLKEIREKGVRLIQS